MDYKKIKKAFFSKLDKIDFIDGFYNLEPLGHKHTKDILSWRNDPNNLELFESDNELTEEMQMNFIDNYKSFNRVDVVLNFKNQPIGVFNIKNLDTRPEYGSLIGSLKFRGKGLGTTIKKAIIKYWFYELNQEVIYVKIKNKNQFLIDSNIKLGFKLIAKEGKLSVLELKKEL